MIKSAFNKLCIVIAFFVFLSKFWNYYLYYKTNSNLIEYKDHFIKSKSINIRILSYNIFLLPNPFFFNLLDHKHSDFKDDRCKLISKIIKKYDIILFQEIHPSMNFRCNLLIDTAKKNGLKYSYYSLGPSLISRYCLSNGLLIISRYPIIETGYTSFSTSSSYDNMIEKGCIYAKVKINNELPDINVFNTHLQASYDKSDIWETVRKTQLKELRHFMDTKCDPNKDVVVFGGDFNINFGTTEAKNLFQQMSPLKDSFIHNNFNHTITIPFNKDYIEDTSCCLICKKCKVPNNYILEKQRLDYIYYSKKKNFQLLKFDILPFYTKKKQLMYKQLSDHNAIYAQFKLTI